MTEDGLNELPSALSQGLIFVWVFSAAQTVIFYMSFRNIIWQVPVCPYTQYDPLHFCDDA